MPATYQMSAPLNEAELTELLMASPMYQKLELMKKSLAGHMAASGGRKKGKVGSSGRYWQCTLLKITFIISI